jgi:hypothetical protein
MHKLATACLLIVAFPAMAAALPRASHQVPPPKPTPALRPSSVAPPASAVCLNPKKSYNADYMSGRAVLIEAKVGKAPRAKLKADTNCIGIDSKVHIKLDAKGECVAAGDDLKLRRNGDYGWQTCQITQLTPVTSEK